MTYELIDQGTGLEIAVKEESLAGLFETACRAMFDQIVDRSSVKGLGKTRIGISGENPEALLAAWLRELLDLWGGREYLIGKVRIESISETGLSARIWYDPYDSKRHDLLDDIKAVASRGLSVRKAEAGWEARILFEM
jgi:SHS2 domain-containing protein